MPPSELQVFDDASALCRAAATRIAAAAAEAVGVRGVFRLTLSGGTTPRALYRMLARERAHALPWDSTELYFGDERGVPPDDESSNFRMVKEALLDRLPVAPRRVHRIEAERGAREAAARYEATLRAELAPWAAEGWRSFDVTLLGMGADGHVASLFPRDAALEERERWVLAVEAPPPFAPRERVTLTLPVIGASRLVLFLVAGAGKRAALARVLDGDDALPATRVAAERVAWLVGRESIS